MSEGAEETIDLDAFEDQDESYDADHGLEVLRIEADLHVAWHGVRGCCSGGRPQREVDSRFNTWRGEQIGANPGRRYLRSGHGGGTARCSSSGGGGWPNPPESCRGGATVKAYIEFL